MRHRGARKKNRVDVTSERRHPCFFGHLFETARDRSPSRVHQHVEAPEALHGLIHATQAVPHVCDIRLYGLESGSTVREPLRKSCEIAPEREASIRDAPCAANARAVAAPMPLVPPVMRQAFPLRSIIVNSSTLRQLPNP